MAVSTKTRQMQRLLLRMIGQEEVGIRIKEAREDAQLTQQELANAIGVSSAQSISRYERGETEVPAKRLRRISEVTSKPMSFFVQEVGDFTAPTGELEAIREELHQVRAELEAVRAAQEPVSRVLALARDLEARLREQRDTG